MFSDETEERVLMKNITVLCILVLLLTINVLIGRSSEASTEKKVIEEIKVVGKLVDVCENRKAENTKTIKKILDGTIWSVEIVKKTKRKNKKTIEDTIRFKDGKIESDYLVSQGFNPTNFTIRIKKGSRVIWETLQTNEENNKAFWRGQLVSEGTKMKGSLTLKLKKNKTENYSFKSIDNYSTEQESVEDELSSNMTGEVIMPEEETATMPDKSENKEKKEG
ncbi:MAG: hypothetical protein P9L90_02285 [Candidatus Aadella gelida]|nr:hypothetical protein [Candidatus Aadella gelida]